MLDMRARRGAVMCGIGYLLSIMGSLVLLGGYSDANVRTFAELYVAGTATALCATALFVGPQRMCRKMVEKTRRIGTALWFLLVIGIFVAAMLHAPIYVIFVLLFFETLAGIWLAASYIPFGRKMIIGFCQGSLFSPCPAVCTPMYNIV